MPFLSPVYLSFSLIRRYSDKLCVAVVRDFDAPSANVYDLFWRQPVAHPKTRQ